MTGVRLGKIALVTQPLRLLVNKKRLPARGLSGWPFHSLRRIGYTASGQREPQPILLGKEIYATSPCSPLAAMAASGGHIPGSRALSHDAPLSRDTKASVELIA